MAKAQNAAALGVKVYAIVKYRTKKLDRIDRMNKIVFILNSCPSLIFNFSNLDIVTI